MCEYVSIRLCEHVFGSVNVGLCVSLILSKGVGCLFARAKKGFIVII